MQIVNEITRNERVRKIPLIKTNCVLYLSDLKNSLQKTNNTVHVREKIYINVLISLEVFLLQ